LLLRALRTQCLCTLALQHGRLMTSIEGESTQQKHNSKVPSISFSDTVTGYW
jgi:hypothetical protein